VARRPRERNLARRPEEGDRARGVAHLLQLATHGLGRQQVLVDVGQVRRRHDDVRGH
jgi:hypothetical protein